MSTPSSSSSSSLYPWKYDIFLSFGGEDTRKTFTDHLHGALIQHGINPFRDVDNLERGEEIAPGLLKAIEESWGSIVVFSRTYVSSTWCLDELAKILEQRKARGHYVFPIFYHIEPSHLAKQSERVQEAFAKHEERFKENKKKIQTWRDALLEVATISGWPLKDDYEWNFIEGIVKVIFTKLSETRPHLKGLHSKQNIGQHDDVSVIGQVLSTTPLVGEAPNVCMETILDYLTDNNIGKIAVWGMPGSGKTLIMKHINNKLINEAKKFKFKSVIWVTVSKTMNMTKLQNDIAWAIVDRRKDIVCAKNECHFEEDEIRRAGKLYEMLVQKGKFVLILDDLWDNKLSLEEVGIPEPSNGSKLVVTTRLLEVCRSLDCQKIHIRPLSIPDAWSLFSKKVGEDVLNCPDPDLLPIMKSVAEECGGLPLAIVTIAGSMKGVLDITEWREAQYVLSRRIESVNGMEEKVFQRLHFSYDRLQNEKEKHCFLCCALYPEDCEIFVKELIELWIAEGLVEERDSRQAMIDKGHTILNKLKNCCLLLDDYKFSVQMHDLMRDMALRITKVRPRFLVRAGMQLREIPDVHEWNEDLEKVSLMRNRGLQIPSQMPPPKCSKLTTLLLSSCNIKSIPDCFFEQMHGLKILDLSDNLIKSLPESVSNLETLTTLLLCRCYCLEKLPSFSKLQALKKLDLLETNIKHLPHGIERLVNLKYLDLSDTRITEIANGIMAKYTSLQYLAVNNLYSRVGRFVRGEEIGGMRNLEVFKGKFYDLNEWDSYIQALNPSIKRPRNYYIVVGPMKEVCFYVGWRKVIRLNGCEIICTDGFKVLSDVECLAFWGCIINLCEEKAFFSWFNLVPHKNFSSLSTIDIIDCKNIKKLFSSNWVLQKNLQNLVALDVRGCKDMEEIIASESGSDEEEGISDIKLSLPKLQKLVLMDLHELNSICSEVLVCDSIKSIEILNCPKLKRISLSLPLHDDGQPYPPPSLKEILIVPVKQWESFEWDQPNAKSLLKPYFDKG